MARTSATSPGSASGGGSGTVTSVTATDTTIVVAGTATDPTVGAGVIVAPATHAATSKATPVDADEMPLSDSAASFGIKKLTWANLKATIKTYTDTLYPSGSGTSSGTNTGDQTVPAFATPAVVLGSAAAAGAASTVIRSDGTIAAFDATAPSTQAFSDAAAVGTAAFAARRDHKHAMPADPFTGATAGGNLTGTFPNPTIASGVVTGTMLVDGTVANADLADMTAKTVKMRHTNSTGAPEDTTMANLWTDLSGQAGASVAMNSQKLTGLAAGTTAGDSVRYEQIPIILGVSGTAVTHTGDTNEFLMATIAIPAGTILANGMVVLNTIWQQSGSSATAPTMYARLGATGAGLGGTLVAKIIGAPQAALGGVQVWMFSNANSASAQVAASNTGTTLAQMNTTGSIITAAINTANASEVCLSAKVTNSANTIALNGYSVICYPSA